MKAKKLFAGACASLMLAAAAIPSVSAADAVKVKIGSAEAAAGEKFSVTLDLEGIPAAGINACDFGIKYDSSVITVTGISAAELAKEDKESLEGVNALEVNTDEAGLASVIYGLGTTDSSYYMTGSGSFLTIEGTVNKTAKAGDKSKLEIVAVERLANPSGTDANADIIFGNLASDGTYTVYTPTVTTGLITVKGTATDPTEEVTMPTEDPNETYIYGDVNLDEKINSADVTRLAKYLLNSKIYPLGNGDAASSAKATIQADAAYDGKINNADLSKLVNFALGSITSDKLGK